MMVRLLMIAMMIGLVGCTSKSSERTKPPERVRAPERVQPTDGRQPFDRRIASEVLKSQAKRVGNAMLTADHLCMADFTHPTVIEKMGGKAKFVERLTQIAAEMKGKNFRFNEVTISEPTEIVEASTEVYAIIPFKLEMTTPDGGSLTAPSYLIGLSLDRGHQWKFVDGSGIAGDREKLRLVLPQFPDHLALPAKQEPTIAKP